ncbi:MAG: sigma-54-dependent Fis family transcriptional regulator [Myxococcales bacterium]|nr:MAG: sigma-54-dependent Fis family transcriptional regulator [Myxococcales bacterium]
MGRSKDASAARIAKENDVEVSTILIVDDEENLRHMLSVVLTKEGFTCTTAADGEEALALLQKQRSDIVLCDINMPKLGGMDFLRELETRGIETTVIMITAYGSVENAISAMQAGAYDYINKPFRPDEVLLTIRKAQERERLRRENRLLRRRLNEEYDFARIVTKDDKLSTLFRVAQKVANFKSTVLITGESGTGKELFARAIHNASTRRDKPFVAVNCGAIPETLIESELFGHEKGAFTDAHRMRKGLFEEADGGTLLLDEISELPLSMQVKLLRVLQEEEIRRIGGDRAMKVDVRIIAASMKRPGDLVKEGKFREDLYYRLNVVNLHIPPLRERRGDIPLLARFFIERFNDTMGVGVRAITPEALALMEAYHWPGNVRELENTIERAIVLSDGPIITIDSLPAKITEYQADRPQADLSEDNLSIKKGVYRLEYDLISRALRATGGNRTAAARLLEISHRALLYKIKEYRIEE